MKTAEKTLFQLTLEKIKKGEIQPPKVMIEGKQVDYIIYQLATHLQALHLSIQGLDTEHFSVDDLKKYYGLKGTIQECMEQLHFLLDTYKLSISLN
jgi:hypothetical protein